MGRILGDAKEEEEECRLRRLASRHRAAPEENWRRCCACAGVLTAARLCSQLTGGHTATAAAAGQLRRHRVVPSNWVLTRESRLSTADCQGWTHIARCALARRVIRNTKVGGWVAERLPRAASSEALALANVQPSPGRGCLGAAAQPPRPTVSQHSTAVTASAARGEELQSLGRTSTAGETLEVRGR